MVTAPDWVLLNGSRSILWRVGVEKRTPSPKSTRDATKTRISSRPSLQALAGQVGAEDLQVLSARGA